MKLAYLICGTIVIVTLLVCITVFAVYLYSKKCSHHYEVLFERNCSDGMGGKWQNQICRCTKCGKLKKYNSY